jgi:hypothetical protein
MQQELRYSLTHLLVPVVLHTWTAQPLGGGHIVGLSTESRPVHPSRKHPWTSVTRDRGLIFSDVNPVHPCRKKPWTTVTCDRGLRSSAVSPLHPKKKNTYTGKGLVCPLPRRGRNAFESWILLLFCTSIRPTKVLRLLHSTHY